jgi:hypothetical protein
MNDLDKALAEALGQRVCGGLWELMQTPVMRQRCSRCGLEAEVYLEPAAGRGVGSTHLPPPPYSTSWEAAGRLVEEMRRRGWSFALGSIGPESRYSVGFWQPGLEERGAVADTAPEAIARAALRRWGGRGERHL